jgi:hypothetical protein
MFTSQIEQEMGKIHESSDFGVVIRISQLKFEKSIGIPVIAIKLKETD